MSYDQKRAMLAWAAGIAAFLFCVLCFWVGGVDYTSRETTDGIALFFSGIVGCIIGGCTYNTV